MAEISIITPSLNRRELLKQTIQSVQAQTFADWELVIVDDGSADGTREMVHEKFGADGRVRFMKRSKEKAGACACRNQGGVAASGKYLLYLDSDDLLAPHCLEKRIAFMRLHPELDFAVFYCAVFFKEPGDSSVLWNHFNEKRDIERFLSFDVPWGPCSVIWNTKTALSFGGWDEDLLNLQDVDFHIRALMAGLKYSKAPFADCYYRLNTPGSIGEKSSGSAEHFKSKTLFFGKTARLLRRNRAGDADRRAFASTLASHCDNWLEGRHYGAAVYAWFSGLRDGLFGASVFLLGMKRILKTVLTGEKPKIRDYIFGKIKDQPQFYIYNRNVCGYATGEA